MKNNSLPTPSPAVVLDRHLAASRARLSPEVKHILTGVLKEAVIEVVHEFFYQVDFGPDVRPQVHIVSHDLYCTCALEADCPAVTAVKVHLQRGLCEPAKMPRPGYFPTAPHRCPVCGARAGYNPRLSSPWRGAGWSCAQGGVSHYWQHQATALQAACAEKWQKLGIDPVTFSPPPSFRFPEGYKP